MSYLTVHLISDLFLGFNEFSTSEESIPDVDLCVINGNIGHNKRSMLYAETLCKKYPETQFVYNNGEHELFTQVNYPKYKNEFIDQMISRQLYNQSWPSNLHFSIDPMTVTCRGQKQVDILCLYGYPFIHRVNCAWEETNWHQYYSKQLLENDKPEGEYFKPKETSNVNHGTIHIPADINYINEMYSIEHKKAKKFELMPTSNYKIYVTHFHPYQDTRLSNIDYSTYDIHIDKTSMWLSSNSNYNTLQFLGGKLYSNSGRGSNARNAIIYFN